MCKSFTLCHNSHGLAWTSVDVFSALEPLFEELQLKGEINDYVDVVALPGACAKPGCCCSTPVEVQLSLPYAPGSSLDMLVDTVASFVRDSVPSAMRDVVCVGDLKDVACAAEEAAAVAEQEEVPVIVERRRLRWVRMMMFCLFAVACCQ